MGTAERRKNILRVLYRRKHETIDNLALEFEVSTRTIRRDLETLSLTEPIYTQAGRYGGGVYVLTEEPLSRIVLTFEEFKVLHKLCSCVENKEDFCLTAEDIILLKNIIKVSSIRKNRKEK